MKKTIISISVAALMLAGVFTACNKSDKESLEASKVESPQLVTTSSNIINPAGNAYDNELLAYIGISSVMSKNITQDQALNNFLLSRNISPSQYDFINAQVVTVKGRLNEIGIILKGKNNSNNCLTVNVITSQGNYVSIDKKCELRSTFRPNGTLKGVTYLSQGFPNGIKAIDLDNMQFLADENQLGPRRNGESFNDCFERNWENFGTDFVSIMAQTLQPVAIAAAIAITCAPK